MSIVTSSTSVNTLTVGFAPVRQRSRKMSVAKYSFLQLVYSTALFIADPQVRVLLSGEALSPMGRKAARILLSRTDS